MSTRLARDHYVRVDANDYSVHPSAIGRRVDIQADAGQVVVTCDGQACRCPREVLGGASEHHRSAAPRRRDAVADRAPPRRRNPDPHRGRTPRPIRLRPHGGGSAAILSHPVKTSVRPRQRRGGLMPTKPTTGRNVTSELAFLARALKAPRCAPPWNASPNGPARSPGPMRSSSPPACNARSPPASPTVGSGRPVPGPQVAGGVRLRASTLAETRQIAHLGTLDFVTCKENVVFLGPPGTGTTHLSIGLGIRACQAGHRVAFATAAQWVARGGPDSGGTR